MALNLVSWILNSSGGLLPKNTISSSVGMAQLWLDVAFPGFCFYCHINNYFVLSCGIFIFLFFVSLVTPNNCARNNLATPYVDGWQNNHIMFYFWGLHIHISTLSHSSQLPVVLRTCGLNQSLHNCIYWSAHQVFLIKKRLPELPSFNVESLCSFPKLLFHATLHMSIFGFKSFVWFWNVTIY
jgi:hypothetical protein